jgi:hypothetical protein
MQRGEKVNRWHLSSFGAHRFLPSLVARLPRVLIILSPSAAGRLLRKSSCSVELMVPVGRWGRDYSGTGEVDRARDGQRPWARRDRVFPAFLVPGAQYVQRSQSASILSATRACTNASFLFRFLGGPAGDLTPLSIRERAITEDGGARGPPVSRWRRSLRAFRQAGKRLRNSLSSFKTRAFRQAGKRLGNSLSSFKTKNP